MLKCSNEVMSVTAKLRYLRIAPRKVRLVADLIRGKKVSQALRLLQFTPKRAALSLEKLLRSALANARHNFGLEEDNLYISKITVDEGPKLKRWMPRARGRAFEIQKKTSHVTLVLDSFEKKKIKKPKTKKIEGAEKIEKISRIEKPKKRPEIKIKRPKIEKIVPRIFRRKAF